MKDHFSIGILLLICAQCAHSASIPVKREAEITAADIAELNAARKEIADNGTIANMHELVLDDEYKQKLLKGKCDELKGDFVFVPYPTPDQKEKVKHQLQKKLQQMTAEQQRDFAKEFLMGTMGTFFNPKFSRIACEELAQPCQNLKAGCLIGPGSSISDSDAIMGEPGSKCPNGKASSGLCAGGSTSGSSIGGYSLSLALVIFAYLNFI